MDKMTVRPRKTYSEPRLYASTKLWAKTLRKFRIISAEYGRPMVAILDDWADKELAKIKKKGEKTE